MSKKIDEQFYVDPDYNPEAISVCILSHYGMLSKLSNWRDSIWKRTKKQRKSGDFGYNATERRLTLKELKSLDWDFIYVLEDDKEYERKEFFEKYNKTSKPLLTGFFEGIKGKKGIVNIEKPGYYEKRALKRIKIGDKRCGHNACWEVISLRPFRINVISGGKQYKAETTRREFLEFGERLK